MGQIYGRRYSQGTEAFSEKAEARRTVQMSSKKVCAKPVKPVL